MRFGLALPSFSFADLDYAKAARLREFAQQAEARGYESLWAVEHLLTARGLYGTAWLSPLETLSFAAGCTERIRLATGILIAALRNPVFIAKEIASLQYLSGGRFELGIGVGWGADEYGGAAPAGWRPPRRDPRYPEKAVDRRPGDTSRPLLPVRRCRDRPAAGEQA